MESHSTSSTINRELVNEIAAEADRQGIEEVSQRHGRIQDIGAQSKKQLMKVIFDPQTGKNYKAHGEGASATDGSPIDYAAVLKAGEEEIEKKQQIRDRATNNDPNEKVDDLGPEVAGLYDGQKSLSRDLLVEGKEEEIRRTHLHETKHEQDGLLPSDLDKPLLDKTGIPAIDRRLASIQLVTKRNIFEKGAMLAEKKPPRGSYIQEHWQPANRLEKAFEEVGLDGRRTLEKVEKNDITGFQQDTRALIYHHAMKAQQN